MLTLYHGILAFVACGLYLTVARRHKKRFPPGPKPLPILGNALDVPQTDRWITFAKWKDQYGDIVHVTVFGRHIVVLNSAKVTSELLEKRSAKASGRPQSVMMHELMNLTWFVVMGYNAALRTHRRLFHSYFNEHTTVNHRPAQERAVHHLLRRLFDKPKDFLDHIRLQLAQAIMEIVYDIRVKDYNNHFVQSVSKASAAFTEVAMPGNFLVDTFPILKYVPAWFPGAGFKQTAALWKTWFDDAREAPAAYVKESMENGTAGPSMLTSLMEKCESKEYASIVAQSGVSGEQLAKMVCALAFAAGSDTTISAIRSFFLIIANRPECQKIAQTELDTVLGGKRLPNHDDMKDLPYIQALAKETLRWQPVLPTGVPHCLDEDDEYEGYFIPKGTILLPNAWVILRDPEVYPDPHTFNPMRWLIETEKGMVLNKAVPDPTAPFGYGRRICPGRFFASDSLWLTIANVLACYTLSPLDMDGKPTKFVLEEFSDNGLMINPLPFKISITPRSEAAIKLIQEIDLPI